jgi:hypothetical protein
MISKEGYVWKLLWPILRHYTVIFLVALGKPPETSVRMQVLQAKFETVTLKCAERVLITTLSCLVHRRATPCVMCSKAKITRWQAWLCLHASL